MAATRGPIQYASSGDLSIAFQVLGDGPLNMVVVPGFISNLDMIVDSFPFGPLLDRLGSIGTCVMFDKRGTGLSDRDLGFGSLEERADDIRAVMDAVGMESASIFGYSEGGPLSVVYAASHPDRVDALALYGSFATLGSGEPSGSNPAAEGVRTHWGSGHGISRFIQGVPTDSEAVMAELGRYERGAASPGVAAVMLESAASIDVTPFLGGVEARTLILHSTRDPMVPVEAGRRLAEGIAGAEYIERDVDYHWYWDGTAMWFTDDLSRFFTRDQVRAPVGDRVLATIVFTDIASSTQEAARHGDSDWTRLKRQYDQEARARVTRYGGETVKSTGDGLLALFSSPSKAVSAARSIEDSTRALGLTNRSGVHTGEIERLDGDIAGIGVHIASRVMSAARAGEVWVSRTVRDLTTGSGLEFRGEGRHVLKGVPDEWDLYSLADS